MTKLRVEADENWRDEFDPRETLEEMEREVHQELLAHITAAKEELLQTGYLGIERMTQLRTDLDELKEYLDIVGAVLY